MKLVEYKKMVKTLASQGDAKTGLRTMASNRLALNVGHAIIGVCTEVGELLEATTGFLAGHQVFGNDGLLIDHDLANHVREELGDIAWYTTLGSIWLKSPKLPSITKKIKPTATKTELLLQINNVSTELLSLFKKVYYGKGLGDKAVEVKMTKAELQIKNDRRKARNLPALPTTATKKVNSPGKEELLAKIVAQWELLIPLLYQLSWSFLGQSIGDVMYANHLKLASGPNPRYKGGVFSPEAATTRADKAK